MTLFDIPKRGGRADDIAIAKKANANVKKSTTTVRGGSGIFDLISQANAMVETNLGHFRKDYIIITDEQVLENYISSSIANNVISIDTETTGLDPLQDKLVGICIYTPNEKPAYIPVHHVSYITGLEIENQLPVAVLHEQFSRLKAVDVVMFNSAFDIRFLRSGINVSLYCTWDCYLASRLLNENEPTNGLKKLHQKYVLDGEQDAFKFDDLFRGITFDKVPIKTGYLYAAHDAIITYELYEYQKPFLTLDNDECINRGLTDIAWVFHNIEMPCVEVVCNMEDAGIEFDFAYNEVLKEKYHSLLDDRLNEFYRACDVYRDDIEQYRLRENINCKLDNPINIESSTQLAILLYDIMKCEPLIDKRTKKPSRSTNEETLKSKNLDNDVSRAILGYREFSTIVGTFIDKLPNCVNPNDGRIHCKFNQYGADTGRFSSQDPNLQNIPSHNKDIRKMFKATDGYVLMSSDFSQQEPKCLAALCKKQGDEQMYDTFMQGKDLYSEIASKAFNKPYEECKEFREDGTTNKEGKERRSQAKSILLGVLYGRGVPSIAEQLGCTTEKAQGIKDSVFRGFPAIKKFEEDSLRMAEEFGYVTTVCGRKRRLPDLMLPEFEFKWANGAPPDDDPLAFDYDADVEVPYDKQKYYLRKLATCRFNQKRAIFEEANREGIWIVDNGKKISDASRQCVNARIQGSAADLTKLAMIELNNNKRLKELGFRILIPVHDEIIAECPEENAKECSELLAQTMSHAAEEILQMPIKCDVEVTKCWYGESVNL